ncbi:MAG: SUMF1/EgtB/PvdO family nonheme iron enzyme, partial [Acidobacteriota bacterium]
MSDTELQVDLKTSQDQLIQAELAPEEILISDVNLAKGPKITFSIGWGDSFTHLGPEPTLKDAAWVFVKYRNGNSGVWSPVLLATDATEHSADAADCGIFPSEDGTGVFVRRVSRVATFGPVTWRVTLSPTTELTISGLQLRIFALHMVRVPEGSFWLGDPKDSTTGSFSDACRTEDYAYLVESEDEMQVGSECNGAAKSLNYSTSGGDVEGPIPQAFPKGYGAFYIMRNHITQNQYAEFINTLVGDQKTLRFNYGEGAYRYTIRKDRSGNRIATRPRRACNYISWDDGLAYAAWAGLRPMTELEFEKACRGPIRSRADLKVDGVDLPEIFTGEPVPQEYAWGSTKLVLAEVIVGSGGVYFISGNCNTDNATTDFYGGDGGRGPVRADRLRLPNLPSFDLALPDDLKSTSRAVLSLLLHPDSIGASRTGVLGLSGNLWEFCVGVGIASGRGFTGNHGQGVLTRGGEAPHSLDWPRNGFGFRGGSWYTESSRCRVADRSYA